MEILVSYGEAGRLHSMLPSSILKVVLNILEEQWPFARLLLGGMAQGRK